MLQRKDEAIAALEEDYREHDPLAGVSAEGARLRLPPLRRTLSCAREEDGARAVILIRCRSWPRGSVYVMTNE
jgi:hypothetical protein